MLHLYIKLYKRINQNSSKFTQNRQNCSQITQNLQNTYKRL
jgi:hypothetical protein